MNSQVPAIRGALTCTVCGHKTAKRSHRRGIIEHLRSILTSKVPFRCQHCNARIWIPIKRQYL